MGSYFQENMEFNPGTSAMMAESELSSMPTERRTVVAEDFDFDPATATIIPKESNPPVHVRNEHIYSEQELEFNPTTSKLEPKKRASITSPATNLAFDKKKGGMTRTSNESTSKSRTPVAVDMNRRGTGGYF